MRTYEEAVSAELFKEGFGSFPAHFRRIDTFFYQLLFVSNFNAWDVFHCQDFVGGQLRIRFWHPNMPEPSIVEVFAARSRWSEM